MRLLEEEAADALRLAEKEAEATKMAIKRKIEQAATSDFQARSLPAKLRIEPSDPEDVVSELPPFSSLFITMVMYLSALF